MQWGSAAPDCPEPQHPPQHTVVCVSGPEAASVGAGALLAAMVGMSRSSSRAVIGITQQQRKDVPEVVEEEEPPEFNPEPLESYLQKRHQSGSNFWGSEWGRRLVYINDEKVRGRAPPARAPQSETGLIVTVRPVLLAACVLRRAACMSARRRARMAIRCSRCPT